MLNLIDIQFTFSQSIDHNYLQVETLLTEEDDPSDLYNMGPYSILRTIEYYDGLGRSIQTVNRQYSPNIKDFVLPVVYDAYGRQDTAFLPYASTGNSGDYNDSFREDQDAFYHNSLRVSHSDYPFNVNEFDDSPLNRVMKQGISGYSWQLDNNPLNYGYRSNTIFDQVKLLKYSSGGGCICNGADDYNAGSLYVKEMTDENGTVTREYTDKLNRQVMKESINGGQKVRTYYVYDDFGNLAFALSPECSAIVDAWTSTTGLTSTQIDQWVYAYNYDDRHRMVMKKIPTGFYLLGV